MASIIKTKRRAVGGSAGSPATLKSGEQAHNEVDDTLYIGKGDDGSGNATSIVPIGGKGAFADLNSAQTVAGVKTFTSSPVVPTVTAGDSSTKVASTAFVAAAVSASATGADTYQGTWNASTNTPTLVTNTGTKGYRYVVSVAGTTNINGINDWGVGDWIIYNGTAWEKVDNTDAVSTVNGKTGTVVVTASDVGLGNVSNTSDATKNAAIATLTNKTLTSPVINSPTGLVKADVGLGNVDNTSDATKNTATATLTNKTLTAPVINGGTIDSVTIDGGTF